MEITGKIIAMLPRAEGVSKSSGKAWCKQSVVVEYGGGNEFTRRVCLDIFGEELLNSLGLEVGRTCKFLFDIDAHEFNGRWYNNIKAWSCQPVDGVNESPVNVDAVVTTAATTTSSATVTKEEQDLPF